jgi:hypothetical protein
MSVDKLKRDVIDAAQKYKSRYKELLNADDLDTFKRLMDVYGHLDGVGGVTKIIGGDNITISPSGGTGDVTINASTTVRTVDSYVATEGQYVFDVTASEFDFIDVYINGARLVSSEYSVSSGLASLLVPAEANDEVVLISYYTTSISSVQTIKTLSQSDYESLSYVNPNILYVITDDVI